MDKKTRIFAEKLYDTLFEEANRLLKQTNPCKIQNGKCKFQDKWSFGPGRNGCCGTCKNLDPQKGCLTQNLACKTFLCGSVSDENPILRSQLDIIAERGDRFFYLHCFETKEELLSTFEFERFVSGCKYKLKRSGKDCSYYLYRRQKEIEFGYKYYGTCDYSHCPLLKETGEIK